MLRQIQNFLFDDLFRASWRSLILLWKPMAGWIVVVYLFFSAFLAPLFLAALNKGIFRGDRLIVGNEELAGWIFSPAGFVYLFLLLLVSLTGLVIRYAGLFQILTDHLLGRNISVRETLLHIVPRIPVLVKLCAITIAGTLLLIIPFLLGLYLVYRYHIYEFDLNYYIISMPPEWRSAVITAGIWTALWGLISAFILACILPALPAYLNGEKSMLQSVREVWDTPVYKTLQLIKTIFVIASIWLALRLTSDAFSLLIFINITEFVQSHFNSLRPLAFVAGTYLFVTLVTGALLSFTGFAFISTVITKFYYGYSQPKIPLIVPGFQKLVRRTLSIVLWWLKPVRLFSLLAILLAGSALSGWILLNTEPAQQKRVAIIAHRGGASPHPENSLSALEQSIETGADYAEIDIQRNADGTIVLLHDTDLMRMAGDPRKISKISDDELKSLLLVGNTENSDQPERIPTLRQALERAKGQIGLMIELKYIDSDPQLAEEAVRLVREYGMEDQVLFASLNLEGVRRVKEIAPDLRAGYISAVAAGDISRLDIDFLSVNHSNITHQMVEDISAQNIPFYAWTPNTPSDIASAIEKGVDGIVTDAPDTAISIAGEMANLTYPERLLLRLGLLIVDGQSVLMGE